MVEMQDSSVLAQLGPSNMQIPIAHALGYPHRIASGVAALNWTALQPLTFEKVDDARFPALQQAKAAFNAGKHMPCVLNAANEVAIDAFLQEKLPFLKITALIDHILSQSWPNTVHSLDDLLSLDQSVRHSAAQYIKTT